MYLSDSGAMMDGQSISELRFDSTSTGSTTLPQYVEIEFKVFE